MTRKLTITVSDDVYTALRQQLGPRRIAGYVDRLLRRNLQLADDQEQAYAGYARWLEHADGREEAAEIDDWLAGDDLETGDEAWPESWYGKAGLARP